LTRCGVVFDMQALLSQIDNVAGSDNFERTISTFDHNFSTNLMDLLDRIMDFSVSNCEHKLMNILYRSVGPAVAEKEPIVPTYL